jgi:glucosyl-dolichyl phosphate glucuronosyltransferase
VEQTKKTLNPLVSIIVCTYNRCRQLAQTLESIFQQDYSSYEVIVVDNNSTDETRAVVAKFPAKYILESRPGVAYARNTGWEASSGEYVGFVDDDETVVPGWINGMLSVFALQDSVAAATGPVIPCYEVSPSAWLPKTFHGDDKGPQDRLLADNEAIGTGNSLFYKPRLDGIRFKTNLGRAGNNLLSGEDTDFVFQLYQAGYRGAYSAKAIVYHQIPAGRTTLSWYLKRYFYEGLTEYARKGSRVFWRRIFKPVPDILALLLSVCSFNRGRIVVRLLRLCQTLGILYGPLYFGSKPPGGKVH